MKQFLEIEIEVPEGWKAIGFRVARVGDYYLDEDGECSYIDGKEFTQILFPVVILEPVGDVSNRLDRLKNNVALTDPQPLDIVHGDDTRKIVRREGDRVVWILCYTNGKLKNFAKPHECSLEEWREWCVKWGADVLR